MELFVYMTVVLLGFGAASVKKVGEDERLVVFTMGRATGVLGPGIVLVWPILQSTKKVDMTIRTFSVTVEDVITRDNRGGTITIDAACKVEDPFDAVVKVLDPVDAITENLKTLVQKHAAKNDLSYLKRNRDELGETVKKTLNNMARSWGTSIDSVEIKDLKLY